MRRRERSANLLFTLGKHHAVFLAYVGRSHRFAQARQAFAQGACRAAGRRGRIVQFVSKSRGKFAECRELLALLFRLCIGAHAIGEHAHQPLRELGQVM